MHERKKIVQSATLRRGQMLAMRRSEQMRPADTTATSAASDALIQNSVGAYHVRWRGPAIADSSWRYRLAGRIPRSPISPRMLNASGENAEKKMTPSARRKSQRGQR